MAVVIMVRVVGCCLTLHQGRFCDTAVVTDASDSGFSRFGSYRASMCSWDRAAQSGLHGASCSVSRSLRRQLVEDRPIRALQALRQTDRRLPVVQRPEHRVIAIASSPPPPATSTVSRPPSTCGTLATSAPVWHMRFRPRLTSRYSSYRNVGEICHYCPASPLSIILRAL